MKAWCFGCRAVTRHKVGKRWERCRVRGCKWKQRRRERS